MARPGLTVCMIVRDERANVEELLPVLAGTADDVVVVDTGSTDGTADACRTLGARVFEDPWRNDFGRARNRGLEEVETSHVVWLDADDRIESEGLAKLRSACLERPDRGIQTLLVNESADPSQVTSCWQLRAFPSRPEHRFTGRVHEQVAGALAATGTPVENLDVTILHTGYLQPEEVIRKARRNLDLLREEAGEGSRDINTLYHWVKAAHRAGELEEAARVARDLLAEPPAGTPAEVLQATAATLATIEFQRGDRSSAERVLREAVARVPDDPLARYFLGDLLRQNGDLVGARKELEIARAAPIRQGSLPLPVAGLRRAIRMELAGVLESSGAVAEASSVYREALQEQPDDRQAARSLARSLIALDAHAEAERVLGELEGPSTDEGDVLMLRATVAFDTGRDAQAQDLFTRATELLPRAPGAPLHLGHLALRGGRTDEACGHYAQALRLADTPETRVGAACGELESGRTEAALEHLARAVESAGGRTLPRGTEALSGEVFFRLGRPREALAAFEKHLQAHGPDARVLTRVADCYGALGVPDAARLGYQEALKLSPGLQEAVQGLEKVAVREP